MFHPLTILFFLFYGYIATFGNKNFVQSPPKNQDKTDVTHRLYRDPRMKELLKSKKSNSRVRCGGLNHSNLTRPCIENDTFCGLWNGRFWHPLGCKYRDITSEQAQKCIGNRTIACVGDSQIRDTCIGILYLLLNRNATLETMLTGKYDYHDMDDIGTIIEDYDFWERNVPPHNHNGYIYPKLSLNLNVSWQIQQWSLYRREFLEGQVEQILQNKMVNASRKIRPIDFVLWNHGLHDWGWFEKPPYGKKFYDSILRDYLVHRKEAKMPVVWVSMNSQCDRMLIEDAFKRKQHLMVSGANEYLNKRLKKERIPYWDSDALMRVPDRCKHSADGVHVNMYVDIMRAKMLIHHLCDRNMQWRENILDHFI
jgi:hypothetical protein